jgi:periplasmic protein TonB
MQPAQMSELMLPWAVDPREATRFRKILIVVAVLAIMIGIGLPWIQLPEKSREELEQIPPQLAQVVLEKRVIEKKVEIPKPVEKPKEEVKKPDEPKKIEPVKPEPRPQPQPRPQVQQRPAEPRSQVEAAREVAKQSGLMAMTDALADMRDTTSANDFKSAPLNNSSQAKAASNDRLVSDVSTRSSGGVDSGKLASVTEKAGVGGRSTTKIDAPAGSSGGGSGTASTASRSESTGGGSVTGSRNTEEIRRIFSGNSAALNAIYQRALRADPSLQGNVLLELTIEPSGEVSGAKIISSQLGDPELDKRILARVRLFNFGAKNVAKQVVRHQVSFLPS